MFLIQRLEFFECATCGRLASGNKFEKKIFYLRQFRFCSDKCMDMCCSVVFIQLGIFIIGLSLIASFWLGNLTLIAIPVGLIPFVYGLVKAKQCIFRPSTGTIVEYIDPTEFGKV